MAGRSAVGDLNKLLNIYGDPATTGRMAKIMRNYYEALTKQGFSGKEAMKIITSNRPFPVTYDNN
jgi:hypothetical protein